MFKPNSIKVAIATLVLGSCVSQSAFAQGTTTLRNPLIPGEQSTPPAIPAADGAPPAVGDGATPVGVTPGMTSAPTLLPWVPAVPANDVDLGNSLIGLPVAPIVATPPGVLGPMLTGITPPPPSTLGADPGMLQVAPYETGPGNFNDAVQTGVGAAGGLPGTGGFNSTIPDVRRGGQQTHQWELRGLNVGFAQGSGAKGSIQDEVARTGPLAGFGLPFGVPTGNGFEKGPTGASDLRNSSIDLGGGLRIKMGGVKISEGSSVQDFGLSATRNNAVAALRAAQATEFGQGFRREPVFSNKTTDFGFPFKQFIPANEDVQKTGQIMPPKAIETNF